MSDKDVCSSGWKGNHGSTVTLKNPGKKTVTVNAGANCTWPFPDETPGFTINAGTTKEVTLADQPSGPNNTYCYNTTGCPGDPKEVNPKTVIIT